MKFSQTAALCNSNSAPIFIQIDAPLQQTTKVQKEQEDEGKLQSAQL